MTTISLVPDDEETKDWAAGVKRLQRMLAPKGFALDRWATISADCTQLLEQHSADLRRLGWATTDVFGVHPAAPAVAVRCYGLGLPVNGGKVVELTETGAVIELANGARQTFLRVAHASAVPLWDVPS